MGGGYRVYMGYIGDNHGDGVKYASLHLGLPVISSIWGNIQY